jgi:hypothetical protein
VVLGDGPERQLERARERGAGRVRFLGHVSNPPSHVAEWRALLVTSSTRQSDLGPRGAGSARL